METSLDANGATGGYTFTVMGATQLISVPYSLNSNETRWVKVGGNQNTKVGNSAYNMTGSLNTAMGHFALENNTGDGNAAFGWKALQNNTTAGRNTAIGRDALATNTTGQNNTAVGSAPLYLNTTGSSNTAVGRRALYNNTTGYSNVAMGESALHNNTTKSNLVAVGDSALFNNGLGATLSFEATSNTAIGSKALFNNTTGSWNTANGANALFNNTTGSDNTAVGNRALFNNGVGATQPFHATSNTAIGSNALLNNTTGNGNTAVGKDVLYSNTTGYANIAIGQSTLTTNTTGYGNIASGAAALFENISGYYNTAIGQQALNGNYTGNNNTAIGYFTLYDNHTGSFLTALGSSAYCVDGLTNATAIGARAYVGASNSMVLGSIAGVNGATQSTKVGIGTTSPLSALHVNSATSGVWSDILNTSANGTAGLWRVYDAGVDAPLQNSVGFWANSNNSNLNIGTAPGTGNIYFSMNGNWPAPSMTILNTGNVGIGTTTPGSKLEVAGGDANIHGLTVGRGPGGYQSNTVLGISALSQNIDGLYNTAIGRESLLTNSTGSNNTCVGNKAYPLYGTLSNYTGIGNFVGSSASASNMVEIGNNSVSVIRGQVLPTTYSDARIKDNITSDVPGLSFITKLRPVTYNLNIHRQNDMMYGTLKPDTLDWEGKYDIEKIKMTGFIAQEVDRAAQEVNYNFSGIYQPKNDKDLYGLSYSAFVVPLVKAVQEQQVIIETQSSKIDQLQTDNQLLKSKAAELDAVKVELELIKAKLGIE